MEEIFNKMGETFNKMGETFNKMGETFNKLGEEGLDKVFDKVNIKESYCIKDKRVTPCTEPIGYQQDKRGRTIFYSHCGDCGNKKFRYIR